MSRYGPRVKARTKLAKALKTKLARATAEGIVEEDLDVIASSGDEAAEADREQQVQIADDDVQRRNRAELSTSVIERGEQLRNRLPAAILSLREAGHTDDAKFLNALSFARFRLRNLAPVDPEIAAEPAVRAVESVEREDKVTVLGGLANLTKTFLTRPTIVAELTRRGIDEAALRTLHVEAFGEWEAGKNQRSRAEATRRESDAVDRQKLKWDANRRMIRAAVRGDDELEKLYAEC